MSCFFVKLSVNCILHTKNIIESEVFIINLVLNSKDDILENLSGCILDEAKKYINTMISTYPTDVKWENLSKEHQSDILRSLNKRALSLNYQLTPKFMEAMRNHLDWDLVLLSQEVPFSTLKNCISKINPGLAIFCQDLTKEERIKLENSYYFGTQHKQKTIDWDYYLNTNLPYGEGPENLERSSREYYVKAMQQGISMRVDSLVRLSDYVNLHSYIRQSDLIRMSNEEDISPKERRQCILEKLYPIEEVAIISTLEELEEHIENADLINKFRLTASDVTPEMMLKLVYRHTNMRFTYEFIEENPDIVSQISYHFTKNKAEYNREEINQCLEALQDPDFERRDANNLYLAVNHALTHCDDIPDDLFEQIKPYLLDRDSLNARKNLFEFTSNNYAADLLLCGIYPNEAFTLKVFNYLIQEERWDELEKISHTGCLDVNPSCKIIVENHKELVKQQEAEKAHALWREQHPILAKLQSERKKLGIEK